MKDYVEELFEDNRQKDRIEHTERDEGPEITKEEISLALNSLKNRKAAGPDKLTAEILKLIEECNKNKSGIISQECLISTFITMPKKTVITLMGHTLRAFFKVIHVRELEQDISEIQYGFRNSLGTSEALFAINVVPEMPKYEPRYVFMFHGHSIKSSI